MTISSRSTPAATTGAVFAVLLTLANGEGGPLSDPRDVAATAALTLLVAFTVHIGCLLHGAARTATDAWLAATAGVAGAVGAAMKLLSDAPDVARSHAGVAAGGATAHALAGVAEAITLLSLFPLALFCIAAGIAGLRSGALPSWLSVAALVAGVALVVNGCFRDTENVPALLVFSLWCLLASLTLVRAARREHGTGAAVLTPTGSATA